MAAKDKVKGPFGPVTRSWALDWRGPKLLVVTYFDTMLATTTSCTRHKNWEDVAYYDIITS